MFHTINKINKIKVINTNYKTCIIKEKTFLLNCMYNISAVGILPNNLYHLSMVQKLLKFNDLAPTLNKYWLSTENRLIEVTLTSFMVEIIIQIHSPKYARTIIHMHMSNYLVT